MPLKRILDIFSRKKKKDELLDEILEYILHERPTLDVKDVAAKDRRTCRLELIYYGEENQMLCVSDAFSALKNMAGPGNDTKTYASS